MAIHLPIGHLNEIRFNHYEEFLPSTPKKQNVIRNQCVRFEDKKGTNNKKNVEKSSLQLNAMWLL